MRLARHDPAAATRYQELKQLAASQRRVLPGTPGMLKQRRRGSTDYWVREHIRADGRKVDEHLGPAPEKRLQELRAEIELGKALAAGSSTLRLLGYQRVDRKTAAVLAALSNQGLFRAGLTLVGSHAYGVLVNEMGIMAPAYRTQDIDLARRQGVALAQGLELKAALDETGLTFLRSSRAGSFKIVGSEALVVNLLAPGDTDEFLLDDPIDAVVLSPNQVIPVRVPSPERFCLHKLYVSQARRTARDKVRKDLEQAAVLAAAVEEEMPGRLADAFRAFPAKGKTALSRALRPAVALLGEAHPEAVDALEGLVRPARRK